MVFAAGLCYNMGKAPKKEDRDEKNQDRMHHRPCQQQ